MFLFRIPEFGVFVVVLRFGVLQTRTDLRKSIHTEIKRRKKMFYLVKFGVGHMVKDHSA